jgi:hypothetical protein
MIKMDQKFNFKKVMEHQVKGNFTVERINEPNIDKAAAAFFQLLRK